MRKRRISPAARLLFEVSPGGTPIGRIVAGEAMKFGWPRLHAEYAQQFGTETPK